MAITKIHPIKSTLNLAISYIVNGEKTDKQILVSTHKCHQETAHTQFLRTRNDAGTNGTVLARHLIQSFLPGEVTPEMAHKIGLKLCKKILKDEYEFVLSTHIDKGYIHNHIIFNNVNMVTGKCYQSNKKSYHKSGIKVISYAKKTTFPSLMSFMKATRKSIKLTVSLGMKTNRKNVALLGKAGFNLTLTE
ncbi:relaxase [Streptococcus pneumoniae]|nr:relaxase [Streptococcus pneumoniae]CJU39420.1 relaxase [Streptococcus pneumoniae]CKA52143.1 relaxase [Streptococcus pneumoniae]VKW13468.1 relaxase [Streptococcus pneumoniae]VPD92247.1 relaxase [Streptococcus pneumoniae]